MSVRRAGVDLGRAGVCVGLGLALVVTMMMASSSTEEEDHQAHRELRSVYAGAKQKLGEVDPVRLGIATSLVLVLGSLAAGAGIGGGGLFVPIYWLILGVGPKAAVPLSNATILGGAIGNFVSIGFAKHPKANRPLIDYEAAVFTQPGELLGVVFGVLLNIILPKIAIVVLLALVLSYNSRRTLKKALRTRRQETAKKLQAAAKPLDARLRGEAHGTDSLEGGKMIEMVENKAKPEDAELEAVLADEAIQFPIWAYAVLIPMTAYLVLYKLLSRTVFSPCATWDLSERGGNARPWAQGVYWTWYWTPVPVFACFWLVIAKIIKKRSDRRAACAAYVPLENDLVWDSKFMAKFPVYALCAGCAAGLLGIGGGMILGPIFMEVNMEPRCATSASAFSILWTAGSSTILWVFGDNLGWQLMCWMLGFGFVSGQIGQHAVDSLLRKTGRPSFVIFLLGSIIGTACIAMVASGVATITIEAQKGKPIFYLNLAEFKCGVPGN
ncbi:hypothetical protein CTAYLR_008216 [Chrysophaeum taylorii]|uniref:Uncharacterized protein n=1 Tax=Chrysophaeum taylorii TaxID=2483200 RepID=A0AAD7U9P1_9STRA|nr:hypothetical protein CTAYLR_008216 [Chrysophaeum taylorii]